MSPRVAAPPPRSRAIDGNSHSHDSAGSWVLTRLLAILLLSGASGLLYHVATSDDFRVASVRVAGNQLLAARELEAAAAVYGANIFWLRQEEVRRRLQSIPAVQSVRVSAYLPNVLEIRIAERTPAAVWESAGRTFLLDDAGRILGPGVAPRGLVRIRDAGSDGATPDGDAIVSAFRLEQLLPQVARTTPREFEFSREGGLGIVIDSDRRVRFGNGEDLEWKVSALVALRRDLERSGQRAELIDLRFRDHPYIR